MSEPTAEQYPICAGCECPDGQCECVECTEYKGPVARLRDIPRDERRAILEHAANEAADARMYAEPTAESCARSRLEKRSIELEQQHGHYAMFAAWREWFVEWNARQPEAIPVDDTLDEASLFAMCCEFMSSEPEPTYTMQQAIDKIVGGLVLEWVVITTEYSECTMMGWKYRLEFDGQGWFYAINDRQYTRCATYDDGANYCLDDYKSRFRAEIERNIEHGA